MSNVESQIAMSLQGLMAGQRQANVNVSGAGGGGVDPRVLQQMLQMQEAEAMGLTKEQEKVQKEQMRQENRAMLGVLLEDTLSRQQQEEAFQRQVQLQNQMFEKERELANQAAKFQAEQSRFILQGNREEAQRVADQTKATKVRQRDLTVKLMAEDARIGGVQNFLTNQTDQALGLISANYLDRQKLNTAVEAEIVQLNTRVFGGAGKDTRATARSYAEGLSRVMLQAGDPTFSATDSSSQSKVRSLERRIEDMLLAASDEGMDPDQRIAEFERNLFVIGEEAGPYAKAILKQALSRGTDMIAGATTVGPDGQTMETPAFATSAAGKMFQSANGLLSVGLGESPMDLPDPDEMFRGVMLTVGEILTAPDPATGEPISMEERRTQMSNVASRAARKFAGTFGMSAEESSELRGYLEAAFTAMLPLDEQIQAYQMLQFEAQSDEEMAATLDLLENSHITMDKTLEYLNGKLAQAGKAKNEATGTGEAAAGPKPTGASDAAQP